MGACFSSDTSLHISRRREITKQIDSGGSNEQSTAANVIIGGEGKVQRYKDPLKAKKVIAENPNCFLSSSETMSIGSRVPHVQEEEDLQSDQIYFLLPISRDNHPLTLPDLCELAITASSLLAGLAVSPTTDSR